MKKIVCLVVAALSLVGFVASCALPPPSSTIFTPSELKYRLLDTFPDYFWCDLDYYPIGSPEREIQNALEVFENIRNNDEEFGAILKRISLDEKISYTAEEKLLVYRQHKLLMRVIQEFTPLNDGFTFVLRIKEGEGERITGSIAADGRIRITKTEPSFNTCPICLAKGTLIDTPLGQIAIEDLRPGTIVWTLDRDGQRVAAPILKIAMTPSPGSMQLLRIVLDDDRSFVASPGHPAAGGKLLAEFNTGDMLDGSMIVSIEVNEYFGRTYDILPAGLTGLYWANGILLASTILID